MQRSGIYELLSSPAGGLQALTLGALLFLTDTYAAISPNPHLYLFPELFFLTEPFLHAIPWSGKNSVH